MRTHPAPRHRRRRLGAALLALGLVATACDGGEAPRPAALEELERLALVPPGRSLIELSERLRIDCSTDVHLLVDRFEVTRQDWLAFLASDPEGIDFPAQVADSWGEPDLHDLPASFMTFQEAQEFAHWRGMRLPTAREWVRVAAGTRGLRFPWGGDAESICNTLELGLGRTTHVGTFEEGTTTTGVHDLIGNVWEWVDGRLPARPAGDERTWAMGGSYAYRRRPIHGPRAGSPFFAGGAVDGLAAAESQFNTLLLDPAHRSQDVGLRCVVEAGPYLWRRAPDLGSSPEDRERVLEVGRRFGPAAIGLLAELAARPAAPPSLGWLLEGARR